MAQQYSLKWNNHQPNFISMFGMLRNTQALVDVTLAAEGQHLPAHKVVLSACSPYFHSLFVENPSQHPIVILKDVTFSDLRTIVDFMYYGEVNITQEELPQMLSSAKSLKVKGLTAVMRSQSSDFPYETAGETSGEPTGESLGEQAEMPTEALDPSNDSTGEGAQRRPSSSSNSSPAAKRRRRRRSSTVPTAPNMVGEENPDDQSLEIARDGITLSSVPRRRDYSHDENATQQSTEPQNINTDELHVNQNSANMTPVGGQWSMMEHTYPRYTNSCFGGGLGVEGGGGSSGVGGMYMGGMMHTHGNPHMEDEMYATAPGPSCAPQAAPLALAEQPPAAPQKRRRTTNPQSEENFQRALEAVRIGGIGFCKAARMFGVNNRTLWLEYKKKGYPNNRPSIKSRIKREHATPPPPHKEEPPAAEPHMALLCHPSHPHASHHLSVGFVDSRPLDLPLQGINILGGLNFNSMQ